MSTFVGVGVAVEVCVEECVYEWVCRCGCVQGVCVCERRCVWLLMHVCVCVCVFEREDGCG